MLGRALREKSLPKQRWTRGFLNDTHMLAIVIGNVIPTRVTANGASTLLGPFRMVASSTLVIRRTFVACTVSLEREESS